MTLCCVPFFVHFYGLCKLSRRYSKDTIYKNLDLQNYPAKSNVLLAVPVDLLSAHISRYRLFTF